MRATELSGQRFGRLTVVRRNGSSSDGQACWLCRCDCGAERTVRGGNLRSGGTRSCGCLQREVTEARNAASGVGSLGPWARQPASARTPGWKGAYYSWYNMVQRCTVPDHPAYPRYGGRGIGVCDEWLDFRNFLADMGEKPDGHRISLERVDNEQGYCASNCVWATPVQQARNRRSSKLTPERICEMARLERSGASTREIAQISDMNYKTAQAALAVIRALNRAGWLSIPDDPRTGS